MANIVLSYPHLGEYEFIEMGTSTAKLKNGGIYQIRKGSVEEFCGKDSPRLVIKEDFEKKNGHGIVNFPELYSVSISAGQNRESKLATSHRTAGQKTAGKRIAEK